MKSFPEVGTSCEPCTILISLSPFNPSQPLAYCTNWRCNIQYGVFRFHIPAVSFRELFSSCSAHYRAISCSSWNGHSMHPFRFIPPLDWSSRDYFLQQHSCESQDMIIFVLDCHDLDLLRLAIFDHNLTILSFGLIRGSFPII